MRFLLRKAGIALTAGSIIFSLSCERHHVGELPGKESEVKTSEGKAGPHGGHQKGEAPHQATGAAGEPNNAHARHGDATAHESPTGQAATTPATSPTPAEFFPAQTPH